MSLETKEHRGQIATDSLDSLVSDAENTGIDTTELNQLKCVLIHLMRENAQGIRRKIAELMEEQPAPRFSPAEEQLFKYQEK